MATVACLLVVLVSLLLIGCHRTLALLGRGAPKKMPLEHESKDIFLSLWLIPPRRNYEIIKEQMGRLSENGKKGPTFAPHITIIGGISCQSEAHAMEMLRLLEEGLKGFGKIPCSLSSFAYSAKVWNQALYFTAELSAPLMNLCQKSRALLGMDTESWTFPAPATYPHMSLFYGVDNVPDITEVESIMPFHAYTLALWRTDPPTLEGVRQWREISTFDIR